MTENILTQEVLKELIHYNPDNGVFTWKERDRKYCKSTGGWKMFNTKFSGRKIDYINDQGYVIFDIFGKPQRGHRMAFLYMTGSLPIEGVDHINGIYADNRWSNLRDVSQTENMRNSRINSRNTSGLMGVSWAKDKGKYETYIKVDKRKISLGLFRGFFEACCARKSAEIRYGFHENHGRAAV